MSRENVRISNTGRKLLDNKELADKVANAIMAGKDKLKTGQSVNVDGLSVKLVTSLDDRALSRNR
jgi:hypothetical protein